MSSKSELFGPLGALVSIIGAVAIATGFILSGQHRLDVRLTILEVQQVADRWHGQDMILYDLQLQNELTRQKPGPWIPNPANIIRARMKRNGG